DVEDARVPQRIMRLGCRVRVGFPRPARGGGLRVGAAGGLGVIPNDHDVRAAVAVDEVNQGQAVGTARNVVHAVAGLIGLPEGGAAHGDIDPVGTLENLLVPFDEGPDQGAGRIEVWQRLIGRSDAVVVGRPPYFIRSRVQCRRR